MRSIVATSSGVTVRTVTADGSLTICSVGGTGRVLAPSRPTHTANAFGRFNPRSRARMHDHITVAVATDNLHYFDPKTYRSIWT